METTNAWYQLTGPDERITQGDLIPSCPLLTWGSTPTTSDERDEAESLVECVTAFRADVVVMTQACDLEHGKVPNVVLCPHDGLAAFKGRWEQAMLATGNNPTAKAWRNTCNDIADGYVWDKAFLNSYTPGEESLRTDIRVVDFHSIFTIPRTFLEHILRQRRATRLRLLPPYREHLSQAFARFFMRVGLPQPLARTW